MSGNVHYVEQGSPEWYALRCGKVTASRISDIFAKTKSGPSASRANYKAELIIERLTGKPYTGFHSKDMDIGKELEPVARAEYELRHRCDVTPVGFIDHPTIPMAGASTDGLVGAEGMVEFKCPKPATHLKYLESGSIPGDYLQQITWGLACLPAREWCDFAPFNPDWPEPMQSKTVRVFRDEKAIREMELGVREFLREVEIETEALRRKYLKVA